MEKSVKVELTKAEKDLRSSDGALTRRRKSIAKQKEKIKVADRAG